MANGIPSRSGRRDDPANRPSTNAARLSFPLQLVIGITTIVVSVAATQWATQAQMRSDIRDIKTRLELREQLDVEKGKLQDIRAEALAKEIERTRQKQEQLAVEVQSLKEMVLKIQPK